MVINISCTFRLPPLDKLKRKKKRDIKSFVSPLVDPRHTELGLVRVRELFDPLSSSLQCSDFSPTQCNSTGSAVGIKTQYQGSPRFRNGFAAGSLDDATLCDDRFRPIGRVILSGKEITQRLSIFPVYHPPRLKKLHFMCSIPRY
jgi:hypothetical protein